MKLSFLSRLVLNLMNHSVVLHHVKNASRLKLLFTSRLFVDSKNFSFSSRLVLSLMNYLVLVSSCLEFRINLSFSFQIRWIISFSSRLVLNSMNHSIVSHHVKMRLVSIFSSRSRSRFLHIQKLRRSLVFKKENYCHEMKSSLKILFKSRSNLV